MNYQTKERLALFLVWIMFLIFILIGCGLGINYERAKIREEARQAGVGEWYLNGESLRKWRWITPETKIEIKGKLYRKTASGEWEEYKHPVFGGGPMEVLPIHSDERKLTV